ncbi:unnamed protein product, partial [Leptidea sinapis]
MIPTRENDSAYAWASYTR